MALHRFVYETVDGRRLAKIPPKGGEAIVNVWNLFAYPRDNRDMYSMEILQEQ